jgi:hypothetical protein
LRFALQISKQTIQSSTPLSSFGRMNLGCVRDPATSHRLSLTAISLANVAACDTIAADTALSPQSHVRTTPRPASVCRPPFYRPRSIPAQS